MSAGIRRLRAVNYRCLRDVDVKLDEFHVLVGANGSGKSALFDALLFARDILSVGLDAAVDRRTSDFRDLVWDRPDHRLQFRLKFELGVSENVRNEIRHRAGTGGGEGIEEIPEFDRFIASLVVRETKDGLRATLDAWPKPKSKRKRGAAPPTIAKTRITFEPARSFEPALDTLDIGSLLVSREVVRTLLQIDSVTLNNRLLHRASPSRIPPRLASGGALPSLVRRLQKYPKHLLAWKEHIRTAIADIKDIRVKTRDDDRHSYLVVVYDDGLEVPSWGLSDGTLRLLALTIIAYLPENGSAYLIEEPENGVHPLAVEAVYRSLSSAHGAQVLIATHSPVLLACTEPRELLCFSKRDGETRITRGDKHHHLADWQSAADVDLLFASDVLG